MKIVKFKKGTYGVRVGKWYNGYSFLDEDLYTWSYSFGEHIEFYTLKKAFEVLNKYKQSLINPYKPYIIIHKYEK